MAYTAKVDRDLCIGAGACVADVPEAFAFDEENIAVVLPGAAEVPGDRLLSAARACPATAIFVFDEDGQEIDVFG